MGKFGKFEFKNIICSVCLANNLVLLFVTMLPPMLNVRSLSVDDGGLDRYLAATLLRSGSNTWCLFHQSKGSSSVLILFKSLYVCIWCFKMAIVSFSSGSATVLASFSSSSSSSNNAALELALIVVRLMVLVLLSMCSIHQLLLP